MKRLVALIAITVSVGVAGCANTSAIPKIPLAADSPEYYAPTLEPDYHIQVGDLLAIRSYYDSQLNQDVGVRVDGRISLLLLGDVDAVGKTLAELQAAIVDGYGSKLDAPEVTVVLARSAGMAVYLGGEVRVPSMQPMEGPLTLLQAVSLSGGFLATASLGQVLLLRHTDDGQFQVFQIDANAILANASPDVYLRRHDIVYVPRSLIANIDKYVDQYINQVVPHAVLTTFGLQWQKTSGSISTSGGTTTTVIPP
jgi:protein involved in polysaccharide export with SLBB domain